MRPLIVCEPPATEGARRSFRANRAADTQPEIRLRRALWQAGLRGYRKNLKTLPGKPDIVFSKQRLAIFVHGCFWHGCKKCAQKRNLKPAANAAYWSDKVARNKERDRSALRELREKGWRTLVVWECELKADRAAVIETVAALLECGDSAPLSNQRVSDR